MPLTVTIPDKELFDAKTGHFITIRGRSIVLEHSLLSVVKWESKWHKTYFDKVQKTPEESVDYIRCMCITQNVDPSVFLAMNKETVQKIADYINDPMTGTKLRKIQQKPNREIVTNELIYYWMTEFGIPFDPCEKWHLNRLMTLIEVCARKNSPPKKRGAKQMAQERSALNAQRRAKYNTRG